MMEATRAQFPKQVIEAMMIIYMSSMPSKVIGEKAYL
jgi:predicted transcriptional regulator